MKQKINVTIWNEFQHEKKNETVKKLYPNGMHTVIADYLKGQENLNITTATLDEEEHGLSEEVLNNTNVLIWWGHMAHDKVDDKIVERAKKRVLEGMGLIVLHSGHFSKIFKSLMGTHCSLKWREEAEKERLWNIEPNHPITKGIGEYIELKNTEMYGERFDIPDPDKVIFLSWFEGGEVFRSGCTWQRGNGKVFYFRPGHETYPIFYNKEIMQVIQNAVYWAKEEKTIPFACPNAKPLEKLSEKNINIEKAGILQEEI